MIIGKIETGKIDKDKLYKNKKGATMLDVVLIETPNSQYGQDYMIVQGVSEEQRKAGVKGPIIGNAKIIGQAKTTTAEPPPKDDEDDVPF